MNLRCSLPQRVISDGSQSKSSRGRVVISQEAAACSIETSMRVPLPDSARSTSAIMTPANTSSPALRSISGTPDKRRWAVGGAGEFHVAGHGLDHRVVAGGVGIFRTHGRDAGPDQVRLDGGEAFVVDAELLVALGHGVAAEDIDIEVLDQPAQHLLALGSLRLSAMASLPTLGAMK
jgi:hypothetical protein